MRIGIFFGGSSREREVSFAGGRTVYDNLDKSLFSAVPIFIDPFQNLCLLNWQYIYKGSIRDFYDPDTIDYQDIRNKSDSAHLLEKIGTLIPLERLSEYIDFAFLCLHGINGEDGRIQGLLEWLQIPYSGSGILSSALGMDKAIQKEWMVKSNFSSPPSLILKSVDWGKIIKKDFYHQCKNLVGLPLVIKASHQGSSIGVHILREDSLEEFVNKIEKTLFIETVHSKDWNSSDKNEIVRHLLDFREGPGLPAELEGEIIYRRTELISRLDHLFSIENKNSVSIRGLDSENTILIEGFIDGKEFSCIVIENLDGSPMALPPTEIKKPEEVFTYRSKYLPGLSNKITPIEEKRSTIESISKTCEKLFVDFGFNVYARLDGFLSKTGIIYLNDPNTTSGMMPSSFFFHQAAEIGLNPSQFLTYIIYTSIKARMRLSTRIYQFSDILNHFNQKLNQAHEENSKKVKVGILLGGYSSERHISVESGRNIYEKFASSKQYEPIPLFLTGESGNYKFYKIPINILLKDNADDIRHKILSFHPDDFIQNVIGKANGIIEKFSDRENLAGPQLWDYKKMSEELDFVFIALHGRPGEDGEIQKHLEEMSIPYNGSGIESSKLTIDKYLTNEILAKNGVLVPKHYLLSQVEWIKNQDLILAKLHKEFPYPFIAKPSDDGCSSAVIKIKTDREFLAYVELLFRSQKELPDSSVHVLNLNPKEEFPIKKVIFIEELIGKNNADHFMEITGGLFTALDSKGDLIYHMLDPSEALAGKDILSLEEKFLAGEGQNITPPRFSKDPNLQKIISDKVKHELEKTARILGIIGYCRIDAFVRIYNPDKIELIVIEANSLPGMTPATAIFHQAALSGLKPFDFIKKIVEFGQLRDYSKTN